jgi:hypothetical protein
VIPGPSSLICLTATSTAELQRFKQQQDRSESSDSEQDVDAQVKKLIPSFTPITAQNDTARLEYEEALNFGESKYAELTRFYLIL